MIRNGNKLEHDGSQIEVIDLGLNGFQIRWSFNQVEIDELLSWDYKYYNFERVTIDRLNQILPSNIVHLYRLKFDPDYAEKEAIKKAAQMSVKVDELAPEQIKEIELIFDEWGPDINVKAGEYYRHKGELYKVLQSHTTQADWEPQTVEALFQKYESGETGSCDGIAAWDSNQHWSEYSVGDKRTNDGRAWECHDPQWAQSYEPAGSSGHLAWTYLHNCN
ncbi:MAG: carbohydrate-binding protein [Bacteroidales bacterium]